MKRLSSLLLAISLLATLGLGILPARAASPNLMLNPSVETAASPTQPANWTADSWGTNNATLTYQNGGHTGNKSLLASITTYTSGDAKWIPDASAVTPNTKYVYTDYYESNVATELDAMFTDTTGKVTYQYLTAVNPSATWAETGATFTTPANVAKVSVLHILAKAGSLQTDDFSLSVPTTPVPTGSNLVANPSVETATIPGTPDNWTPESWGTNTATLTYMNGGHTGNKSLYTSISGYTNGDAKWIPDASSVTPGANYTYSDYYQSNVATELDAQYTSSTGAVSYVYLGVVPASSTWAQVSKSFIVPGGDTKVSILHILAANGWLQTDDFSLTPATPVSGNMFSNNSVETVDPANTIQPLDWEHNSWGTNTATFSYLNTGHTGTHSIKTTITSYTSGSAYWENSNAIPITGGKMYDFSDYYKSNIVNGVDATITLSDGSVAYQHIADGYPSTASWTKLEAQFTAPANAVSIIFQHNIYSVGYLTTDDYSLTPFSYVGFKRPIITVTDDDSYASFYQYGLPILQKYGLNSTDYIITSYINNVPGYMTSAQVKGLYASGQEVASHSVDHPDLTTLSATAADAELKNSQTWLQTLLGVPIKDYAAPYGSTNNAVVTDSKKYYQTYRGVEEGYNSKNNFNAYNIQVQNCDDTTTAAQVQGWINEAEATNTWLVLVYHQVDPNAAAAGQYNNTPTDFDAQMAEVATAKNNNGVAVETIAQALAEIQPQL